MATVDPTEIRARQKAAAATRSAAAQSVNAARAAGETNSIKTIPGTPSFQPQSVAPAAQPETPTPIATQTIKPPSTGFPMPQAAPVAPVGPQPLTASQRETQLFNQERDRISQQGLAREQQNIGAIQRRFASMGGLSADRAEKIQSLAADASQGQTQGELANLDAQKEQQDLQRQQANESLAEERGFQSGEAEKGRQFESEQALIARGFSAEEAKKVRDFQQSIADRDYEFQKEVAEFTRESTMAQLNLQQKQLNMDKRRDKFNQESAKADAGRAEQGWLGQIIGPGTYRSVFGG